MNKDKKGLLKKIMEVDSQETDKYLEDFANGIKKEITGLDNNDKIFEKLEILEEFIYKVPGTFFAILCGIIKNPYRVAEYKTKFGNYNGKSHEDLIIKCLDLLKHIRYHDVQVFDELINIYNKFESTKTRSKVLEIIEQYAKYNYHILINKNIGLGIQRSLLDKINAWSDDSKKKNLEIIKVAAKEFLNTSFEGTSMKDEKTMVFHQGPLNVSSGLKKIRKETLNLLMDLFLKTDDDKSKLELMRILEESSHQPMSGVYGDDMTDMIRGDIKYLINFYEQIIFIGNVLSKNMPLVVEIEKQLVWFNRNYKEAIPDINKLLEKIRSDEDYKIFRLFFGDYIDLDDGDVSDFKEDRKSEVRKIYEQINEKSAVEWYEKFNKIAFWRYQDLMDEWKFSSFDNILERIAFEKPKIAGIFLEEAFKNNSALKKCADRFLYGFRVGNYIDLWNKYFNKVAGEKEKELLRRAIISFWGIDKGKISEQTRDKDLDVLKNIINAEGEFSFLSKKESIDLNFHFSLIQALLRIFNGNKEAAGNLIIEEIKRNSAEEYLGMYFREMSMSQHQKTFNILELSKENIYFLLDKLVEVRDLDYQIQEVMLELSKKYYKEIIDVLIKRIDKMAKMKGDGRLISENRYDAIPFHFNRELGKYLSGAPEHDEIITGLIKDAKAGNHIYNWEFGDLLKNIGGFKKEIIVKVIESNKNEDFKKIIEMFHFMSFPSYDILFEIIKRTKEKKIWEDVEALMFHTGVVSGEYGLSEAYAKRAEELKKYTGSDNENIKEFSLEAVKRLENMAKREKERADEDIALRKIEFES